MAVNGSALALVGLPLMVLGTVLLGYAALLDMPYAAARRWWDKPTLLALAAAALVVLGMVLTAA